MKHLHLLILIVLLSWGQSTVAQPSGEAVRLWKGTPVNGPRVTLTPYLPEGGKTTKAVIVCPGGSYCWLDMENEGRAVARWLQENGIAAFLLHYRVQGIFSYVTHFRMVLRGYRYPDPLEDVQRALQYVREHAEALYVNPDSVGVMGFSAGGHLAMLSAEAVQDFLSPHGIRAKCSLRPDFVAPIYPVVTLREKTTHKRSRRALLGEWRKYNRQLRDSLSLELHVPSDCPPVFLVNCHDDPVVDYRNAQLLDSALTARRIPHRYIFYQTGGHGFGACPTPELQRLESAAWKKEFLNWINTFSR